MTVGQHVFRTQVRELQFTRVHVLWTNVYRKAHSAICIDDVMQCNVDVEFKVTLHEQVRYRGTLQYYRLQLQSVTQLDTWWRVQWLKQCRLEVAAELQQQTMTGGGGGGVVSETLFVDWRRSCCGHLSCSPLTGGARYWRRGRYVTRRTLIFMNDRSTITARRR